MITLQHGDLTKSAPGATRERAKKMYDFPPSGPHLSGHPRAERRPAHPPLRLPFKRRPDPAGRQDQVDVMWQGCMTTQQSLSNLAAASPEFA